MRDKLIIVYFFVFVTSTSLFSFGKNAINNENFAWKKLKTIHFDINYPEGMEILALDTAKIAEQSYILISDFLHHELTTTIQIILFPDEISYHNNNIRHGLSGEKTGGVHKATKNQVVVAFTGSYHILRQALTHELVHAFQRNILVADDSGKQLSLFSLNSLPLWFIEGMAAYISIGFDESADRYLRDLFLHKEPAPLVDLGQPKGKNRYALSKQGQSFFYFFEQVYGNYPVGEILRDLRDASSFSNEKLNDIFKLYTGKSLEQLSHECANFYKRGYSPLLKDKIFHENKGSQISNHEKTGSSINICPALSPDGKKIAYLSATNQYLELIITDREKNKANILQTKIQRNSGAADKSIHITGNKLTWTKDSRAILFLAQAHCQDIIHLVDAATGAILRQFTFPFRRIIEPVLSHNGKFLVFIGISAVSSDLYLYNIEKNSITRITNDRFHERNPAISPDCSFITFSSNRNANQDYYSDNYDIFKYTLADQQTTPLVATSGNDLYSDISADNQLLFVSNKSGIYNAYIMNMTNNSITKITDVSSGIFFTTWVPGEKKILCVTHQNRGYAISIMDIPQIPYKESDILLTLEKKASYPESYLTTKDYIFAKNSSSLAPGLLYFGLMSAINQDKNFNLLGIAQLSFSDMFGNDRVQLNSNYYQDNNSKKFNFDLSYYYLKYRTDYALGIFKRDNPYWIYSINDLNNLIQNVDYEAIHMEQYGSSVNLSYPFNRFFRCGAQTSISRYEQGDSNPLARKNTHANLNQLAFFINYDNIVQGPMMQADGFKGRLSFEHAFNISQNDFTYSSVDIDLNNYFLLFNKHIFALRGIGGRIFGRDKDIFNYYIGGFNTLRGHPFLEYKGKKMFVATAEFRFTLTENIQCGWPLSARLGSITGVLFTDIGSAWNEHYVVINDKTNRFEDLKTNFGFGFRFTISPAIILKLDYALAWDKKEIGNKQLLFSLGFDY